MAVIINMVLLLREIGQVLKSLLTRCKAGYLLYLMFQNLMQSLAFSEQTFCPRGPMSSDQTVSQFEDQNTESPGFKAKQDEISVLGTNRCCGVRRV